MASFDRRAQPWHLDDNDGALSPVEIETRRPVLEGESRDDALECPLGYPGGDAESPDGVFEVLVFTERVGGAHYDVGHVVDHRVCDCYAAIGLGSA